MRQTIIATLIATACGGAADTVRPPPAAARGQTVPRFEVRPGTELLSGQPAAIALVGLEPGAEVEIQAERPVTILGPESGRRIHRARATFTADRDGSVDLARAAPRAGTYAGADLHGLFWSMARTQDEPPADWPDERVRLVATRAGLPAAEVALTQRKADPRIEVTPAGVALPGAFLARLPGRAARPAVIVLGGSEGGDRAARLTAPRLASHGYAVLGLPYYNPPHAGRPDLKALPAAFVDIPVERLEAAREWLRAQPGVDAERIAVYGVSKGAEFALIAATRFSWIDAVVAIAPSDVVWEGWGLFGRPPGTCSSFSWRGQPLPFVPYAGLYAELAGFSTGADVRLRRPHDRGRAAHPDAVRKARIPVETYRGALLVAGGDDDQVWASGPMARSIAASRAEIGLATTALVYPDAGHALGGDGWSPTVDYDAGNKKVGGTPAGNARAQAEVWSATLAFLARNLGPLPSSAPGSQVKVPPAESSR